MIQQEYKPLRISAPSKRLCFWGAHYDARCNSASLQDQLTLSGNNTGNLFIGAGLFRNIDCELKEYHPGFEKILPEDLHRHYDYVVIPASNFVSQTADLTPAYEYLRRTKVNLFCFGLGSQLLPNQPLCLKSGTEKFLHMLADRCASIGVRGAFTAEVLWKFGVRNLSLSGCPSLLGLGSDALKRILAGSPRLDKIAFNASANVRRHALCPGEFTQTENSLFQYVVKADNAYYILQNEQAEIEALGATDDAQFAKAASVVRWIFQANDLTPLVNRLLKNRLRIFFDVDSWIGCMHSMTASIGSRFHGNVAAILAGTPALTLVHDMRTKELCELFAIPHVVVDTAFRAEELIDQLLAADYVYFSRRLTHMQAEWKLFFSRNGFDCR